MLSIHDNTILRYRVNLQEKTIVFDTQYEKATDMGKIEIEFVDVLAHLFENELSGSIIFGIDEYEIPKFIEEHKDILERGKSYCWPVDFDTLEELQRILLKEDYSYYRISSSYGLNGWVLAKQYEVRKII